MGTQLYLIHSSDARWVTQQRESLISDLVSSEMRDENLLELYSSTNQALKLDDVLPEILAELSTIPFLPDSRRVVAVHGLAELLARSGRRPAKKGPKKKAGGGAKKRTPVEVFAAFVERDLPATENVLIVSCIVESERGESVDSSSALYKLFKPPIGQVLKPARRETDPVFQMTDALLRRDAPNCIRHFRRVYRDDSRTRIFHQILRNVRFLLQAKVLEKVQAKGLSRDILEMKYLPDDKNLNLYKLHAYPRQKIEGAVGAFQLRELMDAMDRLLEINSALIPSQQDVYAPDVKLLLEAFIAGFCQGGGAAARPFRA